MRYGKLVVGGLYVGESVWEGGLEKCVVNRGWAGGVLSETSQVGERSFLGRRHRVGRLARLGSFDYEIAAR